MQAQSMGWGGEARGMGMWGGFTGSGPLPELAVLVGGKRRQLGLLTGSPVTGPLREAVAGVTRVASLRPQGSPRGNNPFGLLARPPSRLRVVPPPELPEVVELDIDWEADDDDQDVRSYAADGAFQGPPLRP